MKERREGERERGEEREIVWWLLPGACKWEKVHILVFWCKQRGSGGQGASGLGHAQTWVCMRLSLLASYFLMLCTVPLLYWELRAKHFTFSGVCVYVRVHACECMPPWTVQRMETRPSPLPSLVNHLQALDIIQHRQWELKRAKQGFTQTANQKNRFHWLLLGTLTPSPKETEAGDSVTCLSISFSRFIKRCLPRQNWWSVLWLPAAFMGVSVLLN